jgi:periplasmic protein TonB
LPFQNVIDHRFGTEKSGRKKEMLEQLVESKSHQKKSRARFLLTTFVLVAGLCFSAVLWSLFAKDLGTGNENFELSTLVAPIAENSPAPVEKQQKPAQIIKTTSAAISRQTNTLRIDENPIVPKEVSIMPNTQRARPNGNFQIAPDVLEGDGLPSRNNNGQETTGDQGIEINQKTSENVKTPDPPPAFKRPAVETTPKIKPLIQSLGVVNGKAKFLPKPVYTAAAKAIRASGDVNVQVLIDEAGNVVSANAVTGHPLLKTEAERAARNAKFNPTLLSNQPVKVTGVIVYKFSLQ